MAVDEPARHEPYPWVEQHAGRERADTLMALLPPVGRADVATKTDLDHLRVATKTEITALGDRLRAEWRQALLEQTRTMIVANLTVMVVLVSLTYAAVRLG